MQIAHFIIASAFAFTCFASHLGFDEAKCVEFCTMKTKTQEYFQSLCENKCAFTAAFEKARTDCAFMMLIMIIMQKRNKFALDDDVKMVIGDKLKVVSPHEFYSGFLGLLDDLKPEKRMVTEFFDHFKEQLPRPVSPEQQLAYALIMSDRRNFGRVQCEDELVNFECLTEVYGLDQAGEIYKACSGHGLFLHRFILTFTSPNACANEPFKKMWIDLLPFEPISQSISFPINVRRGTFSFPYIFRDREMFGGHGILQPRPPLTSSRAAKILSCQDHSERIRELLKLLNEDVNFTLDALIDSGRLSADTIFKIAVDFKLENIISKLIYRRFDPKWTSLLAECMDLKNNWWNNMHIADALDAYCIARYSLNDQKLAVLLSKSSVLHGIITNFSADKVENEKTEILKGFSKNVGGVNILSLPREVQLNILLFAAEDDFLSAIYEFPSVCKLWKEILSFEKILSIKKCAISFGACVLETDPDKLIQKRPWRIYIETNVEDPTKNIMDRVMLNYDLENPINPSDEDSIWSFGLFMFDVDEHLHTPCLYLPSVFTKEQAIMALEWMNENASLRHIGAHFRRRQVPFTLKRHLLTRVFPGYSSEPSKYVIELCIRPSEEHTDFCKLFFEFHADKWNVDKGTHNWIDGYMTSCVGEKEHSIEHFFTSILDEGDPDLLHDDNLGPAMVNLIASGKLTTIPGNFEKFTRILLNTLFSCSERSKVEAVISFLFKQMSPAQSRVFEALMLSHVLLSNE